MAGAENGLNIGSRPPVADARQLMPTNAEVGAYVTSKYGEPDAMGQGPKSRHDRGYVSADDYYECLVSKLVSPGVDWIDVGCGRDIFPSNLAGAKLLADRAGSLVGVDPDENIQENELLSERFQGMIEDYQSDRQFDLLTVRMVAEHVVDAEACVDKLRQIAKPGGTVVIYTPWKWAPMSLMATVVPFSYHNRLKRLVWNTDEKDTFPTVYKMNTRNELGRLFGARQFDESLFAYVDDCSVTARYHVLNAVEIGVRNSCLRLGLPYPEQCLLAAYRRQ